MASLARLRGDFLEGLEVRVEINGFIVGGNALRRALLLEVGVHVDGAKRILEW